MEVPQTPLLAVYLCGPINGCTDEECTDWRELCKGLLYTFSETIDPMRRDYRGREGDFSREIVSLDKVDVAQCDVILASCPKPSVGTSMEILLGWQQGKLVVVVVPDGATINPWLTEHSHTVVTTYKEACAYIEGWSATRRDMWDPPRD